QIHGRRQRFDSGRSTREYANQRFQVTAVLLVEASYVHIGHGQRLASDVERDLPVAFASSEVARPPKSGIGNTRRASASMGNFQRCVRRQLGLQFAGVNGYDLA